MISFRCSNSKFIFSLLHYLPTTFTFYCHYPVADPDLQLRRGGGGFVLLAMLAFLPSVIFLLLPELKEDLAIGAPTLDRPLLPLLEN